MMRTLPKTIEFWRRVWVINLIILFVSFGVLLSPFIDFGINMEIISLVSLCILIIAVFGMIILGCVIETYKSYQKVISEDFKINALWKNESEFVDWQNKYRDQIIQKVNELKSLAKGSSMDGFRWRKYYIAVDTAKYLRIFK